MGMVQLFVFGDIEMGAGNISDDFISDRALSRVIDAAAKRKDKVELILNGDTFDFIKVPSSAETGRITEDISLSKIKLIHTAHKRVFESLKAFNKKPNKKVYFLLGNHDQDLVFPRVQQYLKKQLGPVEFPGTHYNKGGVHIEHGHLHDVVNRADQPFTWHRGERVLSVPYGSAMVMSSFVDLKEEHPFLERIHSHKVMFRLYPPLVGKLTKRSWQHFFLALKYAVTDRSHPMAKFPSGIVKELYRRWKESDWGVPDASRRIDLRNLPRLCVLGHKHITKIKKGETTIVLPDTWRDEYILEGNTGWLRPKRKHYVHIQLENNNLSWNLVHVPIKRSIWRFKDILKDERKYIALAAQEEGFKS